MLQQQQVHLKAEQPTQLAAGAELSPRYPESEIRPMALSTSVAARICPCGAPSSRPDAHCYAVATQTRGARSAAAHQRANPALVSALAQQHTFRLDWRFSRPLRCISLPPFISGWDFLGHRGRGSARIAVYVTTTSSSVAFSGCRRCDGSATGYAWCCYLYDRRAGI